MLTAKLFLGFAVLNLLALLLALGINVALTYFG